MKWSILASIKWPITFSLYAAAKGLRADCIMGGLAFVRGQFQQIRKGGIPVAARKIKQGLRFSPRLPFYIFAIAAVLIIRLIRPLVLIRLGYLHSSRIGHFAANTEQYLCERDAGINVPSWRHLDLFYMGESICSQQLALMWRRVLNVWPAWLLAPVDQVNQLIPGWKSHIAGRNAQHDRDIHNLLDRFPAHLQFTEEELHNGKAELMSMGITPGAHFVCLIVRDSAYLESQQAMDWSYHNYRDCDIGNFELVAQELAKRGYFVVRMGSRVRQSFQLKHQGVIDYATNGMRNDFMDIYLGASCRFCVSTGTGWDEIPVIFRRPVVDVNLCPLGYMKTFQFGFLAITKKLYWSESLRPLTLRQIFTHGLGFSLTTSEYESKGVRITENTAEEILDIVMEMHERLEGSWQTSEEDEELQKIFWEIFPTRAVDPAHGIRLHGDIRARVGAQFLRENRPWLQGPAH